MSEARSDFGFPGEDRFIIAGTGATAKGHPSMVMSPTSSLRQARHLGWFDYTPPELSSFMTHRRSEHENPLTEEWSASRTLTSKSKLETQRGQHQLQSTTMDRAGEEPPSFQSPVAPSHSSSKLSPLLSCEDNSPGPRPWCAETLAMEEPRSAAAAASGEENLAVYEPDECSWSHPSMSGLPVKANAAEKLAKSPPSDLDGLLEEIDAFRNLSILDEAKEYSS